MLLPEDGDGASPQNVVFKRVDAAVRPRRLYWMLLHLFIKKKKKSHKTLIKFIALSLFSVNQSSFLNMYHVFSLPKDAEKVKPIYASSSHFSKNHKTWDSEGKGGKKKKKK
jgi:hypothetical protein